MPYSVVAYVFGFGCAAFWAGYCGHFVMPLIGCLAIGCLVLVVGVLLELTGWRRRDQQGEISYDRLTPCVLGRGTLYG